MPFNLNKQDNARMDGYVTQAQARAAQMDAALTDYNAEVERATAKYNERVAAYKEWREETRAFVADLRDQAQADFYDKSERWQESDRGGEVAEWIDALTEVVSADEAETVDFEAYEPSYTPAEYATALKDMPRDSAM